MKKIYQLTPSEAIIQLQSHEQNGLSNEEAKQRLTEYGPNTLIGKKKTSLVVRFLSQFKDLLVIILLIAAFISVAINPKEWLDSMVILIVVLINATLGVIQENKAENALEALKKMSSPLAKVIREGAIQQIKSEEIVIGDIVLLETGDYVPADVRIIETVNLQVDESALTGESVPVEKRIDILNENQTSLGDLANLAFLATHITYGRGKGIAYATGMRTEIGKIAARLQNPDKELTPLQKRLEQIGKVIAFFCIGVCVIVLALELWSGEEFTDSFMTAVALAVASIPEALATVVTVILALGVEKMARHKAIVKKLLAVETLGAASVVCSDKTGTLTENKMTVTTIVNREGIVKRVEDTLTNEEKYLLSLFALCTDASITVENSETKRIGDPTELALLDVVKKLNISNSLKRVAEIPFDSNRKMMSVILKTFTDYLVVTKGAFDVLINRSKTLDKKRLYDINEELSSQALRILALGIKKIKNLPKKLKSEEIENDLLFLGMVGMIDPARPEVKKAVFQAQQAGIKTVMITGDHIQTGIAIAKELNIIHDDKAAIVGTELSNLTDQELFEKIESYSVFARVNPGDKVRIVEAWQKKGHVVAMTGDGVNDSPALSKADIGCAMGITGTDVAKEASDVILVDDNYATIIVAVSLGRNIYDNIKKVVQYLLSSNIGEVFTIFVASLLSVLFPQYRLGVPLFAMHLLWVNLITDSLPAFALGIVDIDDDLMKLPPRNKNESFFVHGLGRAIIWQGLMIGTLTLTAYLIGHTADPNTYLGQTMAFMTLSTTQLFHAFNMKSKHSIFNKRLFSNKYLLIAFFVGILLQIGICYIRPLSQVFKVVPMDFNYLLICFALSLVPIIIIEFVKAFRDSKISQQ